WPRMRNCTEDWRNTSPHLVPKLRFGNVFPRNSVSAGAQAQMLQGVTGGRRNRSFSEARSQTVVWEREDERPEYAMKHGLYPELEQLFSCYVDAECIIHGNYPTLDAALEA